MPGHSGLILTRFFCMGSICMNGAKERTLKQGPAVPLLESLNMMVQWLNVLESSSSSTQFTNILCQAMRSNYQMVLPLLSRMSQYVQRVESQSEKSKIGTIQCLRL